MTPAVFSQFMDTPLSITSDGMRSLMATGASLMSDTRNGGKMLEDARNRIEAEETKSEGDEPIKRRDYFGNLIEEYSFDEESAVATIPLRGIVSRGLGRIGEYFGYADIEKFASNIRNAASDTNVQRVILNIDSPGGTVLGTADAAGEVEALAALKPVMVYTNGLLASAAYYVAAPAHLIIASQSAYVGSIGAYMMIKDADTSKQGMCPVSYTVFRSGKLKGAGIDALTKEQTEMLQAEIEKTGEKFRSYVSRFRSIQREDMEGQVFTGSDAVEKGFVHAIASHRGAAKTVFNTYND